MDPADNLSYIDEMCKGLQTLLANDGWWATKESGASFDLLSDPMGESFVGYLEQNSDVIFDPNRTVDDALGPLALKLFQGIELSFPEINGSYRSENLGIIRQYIGDQGGSGLFETMMAGYSREISSFFDDYRTWLVGTNSLGKGLMTTALEHLAKGSIEGIPSLRDWVGSRMLDLTKEADMKSRMSSETTRMQSEGMGPFVLVTGKGMRITERLEVSCEFDPKASIDGLNLVEIIGPNELANGTGNLHLTDVTDCAALPYQSGWGITLSGSQDITLTASCISGAEDMSMSRHYEVGTQREITGVTGWPLSGVDYSPTHTLDKDVLGTLKAILDSLSATLCDLGQGAVQLLDYITMVFRDLTDYCASGLDHLVQGFCDLVATLQDWGQSAMEGLGRMIEPFASRLDGVSLSFRMYGGDFTLSFGGDEPGLHGSPEMLAIGFHLSFGDSHISMTTRLLEVSDQNHYLLINGTISSTGSIVSVVIDPQMGLFDHLVEVTGTVDGRSLEMTLPEFDFKREVIFSLSQVPGIGTLLSNIPSPIPGVKVKVDAGFYFKFATPGLGHPVINEYEQNPSGRDAGNEWVEIYNPDERAISLNGWSLRTSHGQVRLEQLGDTLILPRGHIVYRFTEQSLDNGEVNSFPFAESVALLDPSGRKVDSSPFTFDEENDGRTWQRCYDAGDLWEFRHSTMGEANSALKPGPVEIEVLASIMVNTLEESLEQFEALGYDLNALGKVMQTAINNLAVRLLEVISERVAEVGIFLELAFSDETGVLSTGLKTSLLVDGNFLPEAFKWFAQVVRELIEAPLSPISPSTTRAGMHVLTENIWVQLDLRSKVSLPDIMIGLKESNDLAVSAKVKANLAQLGEMLGMDLGRSQVSGGLLLTSTTSYAFPGSGLAKDRYTKECWLIKVSIMER